MMRRLAPAVLTAVLATVLAGGRAAGAGGPEPAAAARSRAPVLTTLRCVPARRAECRARPQVQIGKQVQLRGRRLKSGMRVSFRWSRGALATKLRRTRRGLRRARAGRDEAGTISVRVTDRAGRRSRVIRLVVLPVPVVRVPSTAGDLPAAFRGDGMWIWELPKSSGGNVTAIGLKARSAGIETVFVKSSDGVTPWAQFSPALVAALHAQGLRVCAWQFVYGDDPAGEAAQGARRWRSARTASSSTPRRATRASTPRRSSTSPRCGPRSGRATRVGFTSFPYVDFHPRLPYSVFLAPGAAQANLPQVYWKAIGGSVDAVSAKTWAHNRVYGTPVAPLGQSYNDPAPADLQRFRQVWASYGVGGLSWWSWQASSEAAWSTLAAPAPAPTAAAGPRLAHRSTPARRATRSSGCSSTSPRTRRRCRSTAPFGSATAQTLAAFQTARGLPPTGETDAADLAGGPRAAGHTGRLDRAGGGGLRPPPAAARRSRPHAAVGSGKPPAVAAERSMSRSRTSSRASTAPASATSPPSSSTSFRPVRKPWWAASASRVARSRGRVRQGAVERARRGGLDELRASGRPLAGTSGGQRRHLVGAAADEDRAPHRDAEGHADLAERVVDPRRHAAPLLGTTLTATSAITGLMSPTPSAGDDEARQQRRPLRAGVDAAHQQQPDARPPTSADREHHAGRDARRAARPRPARRRSSRP